MADLTMAEQTATQIASPVGATAGRFMLNPRTYEGGATHGYEGLDFYFHGRGGAMALLGEPVTVDLIHTEFGLFYPPVVEQMWKLGEDKHPPEIAAKYFIEQGYAWAERRLSPETDWLPLIEITQHVFATHEWEQTSARAFDAGSDTSEPAMRLATGWTLMEWPDDRRHAALHALNLLRELRGGLHIMEIHKHQCDPLQAVLHQGSEMSAQVLGWPAPYPEVAPETVTCWTAAEAATNSAMASFLAPLSEEDQSRLVQLVISAASNDT